MLGHHELRERKLRKNGKAATATVLECRQTSWSETTGNPGLVGNTKIMCKLKLRVEPDGETDGNTPHAPGPALGLRRHSARSNSGFRGRWRARAEGDAATDRW